MVEDRLNPEWHMLVNPGLLLPVNVSPWDSPDATSLLDCEGEPIL